MTLDEAIKHAEELANQLEESAMCLGEAHMTAEQAGCYSCAKEYCQLSEWLRELKRYKENGGWIPTAERLPEQGKYLLLSNDLGAILVGCLRTYGTATPYWEIEYGMKYDMSGLTSIDIDRVTAWMPLPEPYREDGETYETDD